MPDNWNRAKDVFHEALRKPLTERRRFVVNACGDDAALRSQVEDLLAGHDAAGDFLAMPATAPGVGAPRVHETPGTEIGPYKLLQLIGEGGFGEVYMAEQEQPIRRRVALKIIKLGMNTKEVIARFESERQALAMMDHPNIAKVLDAGATESGRPYFVMELVKGVPLTSYCDANHVSTRERLELFIQVCKAVHHAHEKGIIHRDIKPSNVMVTLHDAVPVPKIIDFGIAKATNHRLTEKTLFTAYGACIGTPAYMSPEQAEMSGLDVDKRSDVYALGVLMYELLTGTTPFDPEVLRSAAFVELLRIIREVDPPTPSARLSTLGEQLIEIARNRHADPNVLAKIVRGDLDWIVMKAIEKDRRRRYDSASDLFADVSRYLNDEPVTARRPSPLYRLGKFAKRQRGPLLAAACVVVALMLGGLIALTRSAPAAVSTPGVYELPPIANPSNEAFSLSPDGAKIAILDFNKGQNLAVFDLASQRTTPLTDFDWRPGASWVYGAVWSSDSRRIAYTQCPTPRPPNRSGCELRAVTLTGETSVITGDQSGVDLMLPAGWLPDSSAIIATAVGPGQTAIIGLVPTTGGAFVPLRAYTAWNGRMPVRPSVSPDGQWIAFIEGSPGDIHLVSRDGQSTRQITDHPANDHDPVWSPDGRHLAFLSDRGGSAALWFVTLQDGQPTGEPVRIKDDMLDVQLLGWSTRGLAYSEFQRTDDIYTAPVDPTSGEPRGEPRLISYRRTGHNNVPEWSPDGKYLAFVSSPSSAIAQRDRLLVLLPANGGGAREFPTPAERVWTMRWFGNSGGLGIAGHAEKGQRTLFRLTLATGDWQAFPLRPSLQQWNGMYFDWNPDGSKCFYAWQDGLPPSEISIIERDLQSDRERVVYRRKPTGPDERFRGVRFSPDRRLLSLRASGGIEVLDAGFSLVRVVHDEVPGERPLTGAPSEGPAWSPNGRALLAPRIENRDTDKRRDTEFRLIPADGGAVQRIAFSAGLERLLASNSGGTRPSIQSVVWSPDGSRLAFSLRASQLLTFMISDPLALAAATSGTARR